MQQYVLFYIILLLTYICLSNAKSMCSPEAMKDASAMGQDFYVVLNQTFSQHNQIDPRVWNIVDSDDQFNYGFACGREALCMRKNAYVEDGKLVLRTLTNDTQISPTKSRSYIASTAGVTTQNKVVLEPNGKNTHRICVRAMLPYAAPYIDQRTQEIIDPVRFAWPAIWTMGNATRHWREPVTSIDIKDDTIPSSSSLSPIIDNNDTPQQQQNGDIFSELIKKVQRFPQGTSFADIEDKINAGWKVCNPDEFEFDIMETINGANFFEVTAHWQEDVDKGITCQYPKRHRVVTHGYEMNRTQTYDFDVEWGPDYIQYYINGELKHIWDKNTTLDLHQQVPFYFNETAAYYLILNSAYGGGMAGKLDEEWIAKYAAKEFFFTFDHVKVLKMDGSRRVVNIESQHNDNNNNNNNNIQSVLLNQQNIFIVLSVVVGGLLFIIITIMMIIRCKAKIETNQHFVQNSTFDQNSKVMNNNPKETSNAENIMETKDVFYKNEKIIKESHQHTTAMKQGLLDNYMYPQTEAV